MPKYSVTVTYKQTAYVEVKAETKQEAEELGFEEVEKGNGSPYGDDYDIEVEEIETENERGT